MQTMLLYSVKKVNKVSDDDVAAELQPPPSALLNVASKSSF